MLRHDDPTAADYRFILRGSKGPIREIESPPSSTRAPASWDGRALVGPGNDSAKARKFRRRQTSSSTSVGYH